MRNFLLGLSKFILGLILAMLIMTLAGASMLRYFMVRNSEPPERPTYTNDLPEPPAEASVSESEPPAAEVAAEPEPAPPPEPEPRADGTYSAIVTASVGLILRSGPGTDYDNIGGVDYQESVTVLAEESGWLNIQLSNGEEGWVKDGNVRQP